MKKTILLMIAVFSVCSMSFAKSDSSVKVKLVLKDSTVVDGYLRSTLTDRDTVIAVSPDAKGKKEKYGISRVEKLLLLSSTDSVKPLECVPLHVFSSMRSGKGSISDSPMMLFLLYKGKHVDGYFGRVWVYNSVAWNAEPIAYYKLAGSQIAKPYLNFGTIFRKSIKKMEDSFMEYPALVEELENGTLTTKAINDDPMLMVKELDKILDNSK
jgi:hypothetical protein